MRRVVVIILSTIFVAGGILLFFACDVFYNDALENARRLLCQNRQKRIYLALTKYHKEYNTLPSELLMLVEQGYIYKEDIHCLTPSEDPNVRLYKYFPQNFRASDLPLISENPENHSGKGLRLSSKVVRPVIIETMGDGTIVVRSKF